MGEHSLDDLDSEIVRHLQEDGRRSYREIGRALGVSEGTIRARAKRLIDAGVVRVVAIADPFQLGYKVMAYFLIRIQPGKQQHVIDELVAMPEVTYVSSCTGNVDLYAQVVCRDHAHLWELISDRVPAIGGINSMETYTELQMHKVSYHYYPRGRAD